MRMYEVRTLLDGRGLVESPRWYGDRLYFSDWTAGEVLALDPAAGRGEVVARVASLPLCTDRLPDGRMLIVSSRTVCCSAGNPTAPWARTRTWAGRAGTTSWSTAAGTPTSTGRTSTR